MIIEIIIMAAGAALQSPQVQTALKVGVSKWLNNGGKEDINKTIDAVRERRRQAWLDERRKCAEDTCRLRACGVVQCPYTDKEGCERVRKAIRAKGLDKAPIFS